MTVEPKFLLPPTAPPYPRIMAAAAATLSTKCYKGRSSWTAPKNHCSVQPRSKTCLVRLKKLLKTCSSFKISLKIPSNI